MNKFKITIKELSDAVLRYSDPQLGGDLDCFDCPKCGHKNVVTACNFDDDAELYCQKCGSLTDTIDQTTDLSDIGNEIGFAIAKLVSTDEDSDWTVKDFIRGLEHGIDSWKENNGN